MCEFCEGLPEHDPVVAEQRAKAEAAAYWATQPPQSAFSKGFSGCLGVGCAIVFVLGLLGFAFVVLLAA